MVLLFIFTSCKKSGPIQQMLNLIKYLDPIKFSTHLITIYPEDKENSVLSTFLPYVQHHYVPTSKFNVLFGRCKQIKKTIETIKPDVIHSLGVFPDYMIERFGYKNHVFTCRNFIYEDYPDEYGKILGYFLASIHLKAIKKCKHVRCCSKSLQNIYLNKLSLNIEAISNGIDTKVFEPTNNKNRLEIRKKLSLPMDKIICVYGGVFNGRKNQSFLLENVVKSKCFDKTLILLLGDGSNFEKLKNEYSQYSNIMMLGNVSNIKDYLLASDIYISTSKSEGMPNGVLEAMATGLPVLLSNIPQHLELLETPFPFGVSYEEGNAEDFIHKFDSLFMNDNVFFSKNAVKTVESFYSAAKMSSSYQSLYHQIAENGF